MSASNIDWNNVIKKEARGIDDADFGELQKVNSEYVLTQKGIIDKEFFSFPKNLVQDYDGYRVLFKVTEEEARNSYMQNPQNCQLQLKILSYTYFEKLNISIFYLVNRLSVFLIILLENIEFNGIHIYEKRNNIIFYKTER